MANRKEKQLINMIDKLAEFEEYCSLIGEPLRKLVESGASQKEIREAFLPLIQARQVAIALTSEDVGKAHAAAQAILDRAEGKAKEQHVHTHKLDQLPEEELDAVILSELDSMKQRVGPADSDGSKKKH